MEGLDKQGFMLDTTTFSIETENQSIDSFKSFDEVTCVEGNKCEVICANQKCQKYAILCSNFSCKCKKDHKIPMLCHFEEPNQILKMLMKKIYSTPDAIKYMKKIIQELSDYISQMEEKLQSKLQNKGLTEEQRCFMQLVHKRLFKKLTGKKMSAVIRQFDKENNQNEIQSLKLKAEIEKSWNQLIGPIQQKIGSLQTVIDKFNNKIGIKKGEILGDSKVVTKDEERETLFSFFPESRKPIDSKLLFRASQHSYCAITFNRMCFEKENTVTVIKTQFDKVIGGFTSLPWKGKISFTDAEDTSKQSFLFSITNKEKFTIKNGTKRHVYYRGNRGPIFGEAGNDLCIGFSSNTNSSSHAKFGYSYENSKYVQNNENTWKQFTGGPDHKFRTLQWQVYQITFEERQND